MNSLPPGPPAGHGYSGSLNALSSPVWKLGVILGAGLLARQIVLPVGRRIAARTSRRVPRLASYAIAGTTAALFRSALEAWAGVSGIPLWVSFGLLWGVVAGLLLPLGAPAAERARDAAAPPAETGP